MNIVIYEDDAKFAARLQDVIGPILPEPQFFVSDNRSRILSYQLDTTEDILYFLDIMQGGEALGLQLAEVLYDTYPNCKIVFITDYPDAIIYSADSKIKAFNIIFKNSPELENEIKKTLHQAFSIFEKNSIFTYKDRFVDYRIPYSTIYYVESVKDTKKVNIRCTNGIFMVRHRISEMEKLLPVPRFFRCHKCAIANRDHIFAYDATIKRIYFDPDKKVYCDGSAKNLRGRNVIFTK